MRFSIAFPIKTPDFQNLRGCLCVGVPAFMPLVDFHALNEFGFSNLIWRADLESDFHHMLR